MKDWIRDIIIVLSFFILGVCFVITFNFLSYAPKLSSEKCITDTTNINCFQDFLDKHEIKFSHIVLAQAKLESNNFTSKLFLENNNCFGMKVPASRYTFATNDADFANYAKFETLESCVQDYKSWQKSNAYNIYSEDAYFQLLSNIYAEDTDYVNKLKKLIK